LNKEAPTTAYTTKKVVVGSLVS